MNRKQRRAAAKDFAPTARQEKPLVGLLPDFVFLRDRAVEQRNGFVLAGIALILDQIRDANKCLAANHAQCPGARARKPGLSREIRERGWQAAPRDTLKALAIIGRQKPECRLAQPHRLVQHRVEHRREVVAGGGAATCLVDPDGTFG